MDIHVVQQGETISSIAAIYGVKPSQLIGYNGIENANNLVPGQTIVIVYPKQTYTVQRDDTLESILINTGISYIQLLRNNPILYDNNYIYPGQTLIISFNTLRQIETNGFVYPYISEDILKRTLPYITFLSVFNYRVTKKGNILTFGEDLNTIRLAKTYGTIPLLMISSLSASGESNAETVYEILITKDYQDKLINGVIGIMQKQGYQGINIVLSIINEVNQKLYIEFIDYVSRRLSSEGFILFVTINPDIQSTDSNITYNKLDYGTIGQLCYRLMFLQYFWGVNKSDPSPVTSITLLRNFMDYVISVASPHNISNGIPLIAYDWALPYKENGIFANSMTINSAITLASDTRSSIQFDELSQTPYFNYLQSFGGESIEHIVWSIDARSIAAINNLIIDYNLNGAGIWNIMVYYHQMWTIINSQFDIVKFIPDDII